MKKNILYIGRFEMPDKDAAALRVLANGKILRDLGYNVIFLGWSQDFGQFEERQVVKKNYLGFDCYEKKAYTGRKDRFVSLYDAHCELDLIQKTEDLAAVICYNFPAIPMNKIFKAARKKQALCIADVTEWYGIGSKGIATKLARYLDSEYRMKFVHKRADGLIVISSYLERYYQDQTTVRVPPLVDCTDTKWDRSSISRDPSTTTLVYAGSPSSTKERLDLLVQAVTELAPSFPKLRLRIIGIDESKYRRMYRIKTQEIAQNVCFCGRLPHDVVVEEVKKADYSLMIRGSNRVTNAGFPTKFVESVSCQTAVICTAISDLREIVEREHCGYIVDVYHLKDHLSKILNTRKELSIEQGLFDYRHYMEALEAFIKKMEEKSV